MSQKMYLNETKNFIKLGNFHAFSWKYGNLYPAPLIVRRRHAAILDQMLLFVPTGGLHANASRWVVILKLETLLVETSFSFPYIYLQ
jgi:hypothetical protein